MDRDQLAVPKSHAEQMRQDTSLQHDLVDYARSLSPRASKEQKEALYQRLDEAIRSGQWVELSEQIQSRDASTTIDVTSPPGVPTPSGEDKTWKDKQTLIDGDMKARYVMRKYPINSGGMADIYFCFDRLLERPCVLKVINQYLKDSAFGSVFEVEGKTQARTDGLPTVAVYDHLYLNNDREGILMEYIDPRSTPTLLELLNHPTTYYSEGFSAMQRVLVIEKLAQTLDAVLKRGIHHNDLKPGNIFVNTQAKDGQRSIILSDFGLSNWVGQSLPEDMDTFGTPLYLSPERASGIKKVHTFTSQETERSDVFILGIMAFELLTEKHPFNEHDPVDTAIAVISTEWTAERILPLLEDSPITRKIPREDLAYLAEALAIALAKDPADRFSTPTAFAKALHTSLGEQTMTIEHLLPKHPPEQNVQPKRSDLPTKMIRLITQRLRDVTSPH